MLSLRTEVPVGVLHLHRRQPPERDPHTGATDDLARRAAEHRDKVRRGFASKHGATLLVWYEWHDTREAAFRRERQIKEWTRAWKLELIERTNPGWNDLFETLF